MAKGNLFPYKKIAAAIDALARRTLDGIANDGVRVSSILVALAPHPCSRYLINANATPMPLVNAACSRPGTARP